MENETSHTESRTKRVNYPTFANAEGWSCVMPEELTLGDVVRQLALLIHEKGMVLPFKNEEPWHQLFFRMKQDLNDRAPFLRRLRFDADSRYPMCRELSEFLHALHTTCTAGVENPYYEELILDEDVEKVWKETQQRLPPETREFLDKTLEMASQEFPPKPNA